MTYKECVAAGLGALSSLCVAGEATYLWNPSEHRTDFDAVRIGYAGETDQVQSIDSAAEDGSRQGAVFTGGATFSLADGATVSLRNETVRFNTPVEGGPVQIGGLLTGETLVSTDAYDDWLHDADGTHDLLFPGKSLADYEFDCAWIYSGAANFRNVRPCFAVRTESTLSAEFQAQDADYTKAVRVVLEDAPDGIRAYVDWTGYRKGQARTFAFDDSDVFKSRGGTYLHVVRSADDVSGYGVRSVSVRPRFRGEGVVAVSNTVYAVGSATVGDGTTLVLDGLQSMGTGGLSLARGGTVEFKDMESVDFNGSIASDGGSLRFCVSGERQSRIETHSTYVEGSINNNRRVLLVENARLRNLKGLSAMGTQGSVSYPNLPPTICFVVTNEDGTVDFQCQITEDASYLKGSAFRLFEEDGHIYGKHLCSMYADRKVYPDAGRWDMMAPDFQCLGRWTDAMNYLPTKLTFVYDVETQLETREVEVALSGTAPQCVLADADIGDLDWISADCLTGNISYPTRVPKSCFLRRTDDQIEFQLQTEEDGYLKVSHYRLYQNGTDIYGYKVKSFWAARSSNGNADKGDLDFTGGGVTLAGSTEGASYYAPRLKLTLLPNPHMRATVSGLKACDDVSLEIGRKVVFVADSSEHALPAQGTVRVEGRLAVSTSAAIGTAPIVVAAGGALTVDGEMTLANGIAQSVTLDGGSLDFRTSGWNYLNTPVFMNGASATGLRAMVGARNIAWKVAGTSPSSCDIPISCVSGNTGAGEYTMIWSVDDAASGDAVDFYMNGDLTDFPDGGAADQKNGGMIHRKTGAGTLRWGGTGTCTGRVQIAEGTLLLGRSGALNTGVNANPQLAAKQPLEFYGGTLALEPGVENSVGSVSVFADSSLVLPDGSAFDMGSVGEWTDGARLSVDLSPGAVLRISSVSMLTPFLRRNLRINDRPPVLFPDGTLHAKEKGGMTLILR